MSAKLLAFFPGIVLVTIILVTGFQPAVAAPPTGEVKTVAATFGYEIPIPYLESIHANDWNQLLYDHLTGTTPEGKLSPELGLANKWEMSRDGLTWTFYLRKGVKFHDGVELTAKDVKFSMELVIGPDSLSADAQFLKNNIKSIEVKNPYTVVIHCKAPDIFLDALLSNSESVVGMIVPKDYYEKVGRDHFQRRPIGSGPYKFHSQMAGSFIKLEATDKHWRDGVPRYKYMTYLIIPEESTRIAMLKTGEADIARISRQEAKTARSAGLNVITKENGAALFFRLHMQWTSPVFSDIRFRKAVNLAIDKEAIVKNIFAGMAKPFAMWPGSNIFAIGSDPTLKPYPYDPQEANRLIKEGGWEGHEFTFAYYARAGCPELLTVVEAIAGYWEKIGLRPKIRITDYGVWRKALDGRKVENTVDGTDDTTNRDVPSILTKMRERWYFKEARSSVNIPELNEKYERIEKSLDIGEISKIMAEIYRYAYDHYLVIPICEIPDMIATTKRIPKWDPGLRRIDRNYYELIRQR